MGLLDNLPSSSKPTAAPNTANFALHDPSCSYMRRRPALYIATHNTAPPPSQVITTDCSTTALIRLIRGSAHASTVAGSSKAVAGSTKAAAGSSKAAAGGSGKGASAAAAAGGSGSGNDAAAAGAKGKGKRAAGEDLEGDGAAGTGSKKAKTGTGAGGAAGAGGSGSGARVSYTPEELKGKSNKDLSDLLRSLGLPVSGKKEELIRRVIEHQRKQKAAGPA